MFTNLEDALAVVRSLSGENVPDEISTPILEASKGTSTDESVIYYRPYLTLAYLIPTSVLASRGFLKKAETVTWEDPEKMIQALLSLQTAADGSIDIIPDSWQITDRLRSELICGCLQEKRDEPLTPFFSAILG